MAAGNFEDRDKELELEEQHCSTQYRHHAAEAAKYKYELAKIQGRRAENARYLRQATTPQAGVGKSGPMASVRTTPHPSPFQRFRTEGPTVVIVRLLYEHKEGISVFEMQARNGIAIRARMIKKIVGRLAECGCARQESDKVMLTEEGIRLWEASPLFLHTRRENHALPGRRAKASLQLTTQGA